MEYCHIIVAHVSFFSHFILYVPKSICCDARSLDVNNSFSIHIIYTSCTFYMRESTLSEASTADFTGKGGGSWGEEKP